MFDPDKDFRCSDCGQVRNVYTLRNQICPECRDVRQRAQLAQKQAEEAPRAALALEEQERAERIKQFWETYETRRRYVESWVPGDPQLLPGGEYFVCADCKQMRSATDDVSFIYRADKTPLFDGDTLCDGCYSGETWRRAS
jgi:hypothetical protein